MSDRVFCLCTKDREHAKLWSDVRVINGDTYLVPFGNKPKVPMFDDGDGNICLPEFHAKHGFGLWLPLKVFLELEYLGRRG